MIMKGQFSTIYLRPLFSREYILDGCSKKKNDQQRNNKNPIHANL